jgi:hypothetical protein
VAAAYQSDDGPDLTAIDLNVGELIEIEVAGLVVGHVTQQVAPNCVSHTAIKSVSESTAKQGKQIQN